MVRRGAVGSALGVLVPVLGPSGLEVLAEGDLLWVPLSFSGYQWSQFRAPRRGSNPVFAQRHMLRYPCGAIRLRMAENIGGGWGCLP